MTNLDLVGTSIKSDLNVDKSTTMYSITEYKEVCY